MAIVNFLFGNTTASGFTLEGAVSFDADLTISESHDRSASVTEHPVEDGSTISDHITLSPAALSLTGFVTDSAFRGAAAGRTQAAFDKLEAAWQARQLMQVVTGRKTYENMALVSVSLPRETPESMEFSLEFQQVRLVTPEVVEGILSAEQIDEPETRDLAQPEVDAGAQRARTTQDTETQEQVETLQSSAYGLFSRAGLMN